ncbi:MAG: hypothetical protein Q9163_005805 [Psora crenata]
MQASGASSSSVQRQNSGRDKNKPRISLGPDTKALGLQRPKSFNLVVCGAKNARSDGFIFGDFLGFSMAMQQKNVGGDFWSCFPLEEHFEVLGQLQPPVTDIKFGKFGPNRDQALHTYSKFDFNHRTAWWKQVGRRTLKDDTLAWIVSKTALAKSGDVVNIILESHGRSGGGVVLGEYVLWPQELINATRGFNEEVQVNIITGACYGGTFMDVVRAEGQYYRYVQVAESQGDVAYSATRSISNRIRNSRFSQAFCMSLARLDVHGLQGEPSTASQIRVVDHELFVKEQMLRNITPNGTATEPPSYHGDPVSLQTIMTTMIFRDSVDVLYNPAVTHRRRRIEWPTHNVNLRQLIAQHSAPTIPSSNIIARTTAMLDDEFKRCDIQAPIPADEGAISYYHFQRHNNDFGPLLKLLYWRGRQQSAVYDLYEQLCMRGFILAGNVSLPMSIDRSSKSVQSLTWLLQCFEGPAKESSLTKIEQLFEFQDDDFSLPLKWLATMIVRCSADIQDLLQTILATKYLGDIDEAKLEEYIKHCPWKEIKCNREDGACQPNLPSQFGFWLPHGVRITSADEFAEDLRTCMGRFNRIEECFQEWFGLSPEVVLTEAQQSCFFEANPQRYPN